jgi:hypothetical protein
MIIYSQPPVNEHRKAQIPPTGAECHAHVRLGYVGRHTDSKNPDVVFSGKTDTVVPVDGDAWVDIQL